ELLSGRTGSAQPYRRHDISSGLLYHWERQSSRDRFGSEPTREVAYKDRIAKFQLMVGHLAMGNELLKNTWEYFGENQKKRVSVTHPDPLCKGLEGNVN
ncbi:MAG: hypothetical protein ACFFCW_44330, partial [Candidatus Hodarchaeota archaeon]